MRRHPEAGRKKLRELNSSIASILALVAGQHHEHMDGGGYPDHLLAKGIHPFSRIVAIADVLFILVVALLGFHIMSFHI